MITMMQGWKLFLTMTVLVGMAGCSGQAGTAFDCPMRSEAGQGCYAGAKLVEDHELMEKAARDFCKSQGEEYCYLMIWSQQEGTPLPQGRIRSDLPVASFEWNQAEGRVCFMTFSNGMIEYASEGCP